MADSKHSTNPTRPAMRAFLDRKKAGGEKVINFWLYPEEIAKIDRIKAELGVRNRADVVRHLIAKLDGPEPEDDSLSERAA